MLAKNLLFSVIMGVGILASGCDGGSSSSSSASSGQGSSPSAPGPARPDTGPALFRLPASDGRVVTVRAPAALFFFTSWCGYCKQAMPELKVLAEQANRRGWRVYGVNVNEGPAEADGFTHQYQPNFPIILDQQGQVAGRYGVSGYPTFVVIDKNANIIYNGHGVPRQLAQ